MTRADRRRRGSALLEVVVAFTMLAIAGVSWIVLLGQTSHSIHQSRDRERQLRSAGDALEHISLWDRSSFDSRIGTSRFDEFTLVVAPARPNVYQVTLADTLTSAPVLITAIYSSPFQDTTARE